MPIAKLDSATTRLLASTVNITSPVDLVKELIDNAIDAGADRIEILVSANTLDEIRVRDNGSGIGVDDLDALGRPAHTSKLQTFDQLATNGVKTLGFRGQAFASANTIAKLTVTTKTVDDPVATKVRLAFGAGGIAERYPPASPTTGTTVLASKLFENMPPKRKFLLKESKKSIGRIKELMCAYALANPAVRMFFKVIGEDKHSWKCGKPGSTGPRQKVMELFGRELALNCTQHAFRDATSPFALEALLPKRDCAVHVVCGKGSFVSVNERPVSSAYGVGKALGSRFKALFAQHQKDCGTATTPQKPFFVVRITCAPAIYDVNIASMKDDVLFADERALLDCFEALCRTAYSETQSIAQPKAQSTTVSARGKRNERISEKESREGSVVAQLAEAPRQVAAKMRTIVKVNMGRSESATDDDETMIDVMLPEKTKSPEKEAISSAEAGKTKASGASDSQNTRRSHGIERYFPPATSFTIATDATATPENMTKCKSRFPEAITSAESRQPLQPLSASALNVLANQVESVSDPGSPEISNARSRNYEEAINDRRHPLSLESSAGLNWQTLSSPSPPLSPLIRGQRPGAATMSRVQQPALMHTPPSSDPIRNEGRFPVSQQGHISRPAPEMAPLRGFVHPNRMAVPHPAARNRGNRSQALQSTTNSSRRAVPRLGLAPRATRGVQDAVGQRRTGVPDAASGLRAEHEDDFWRNLTTLGDEMDSDAESMAMNPVEYSHRAQVMMMQPPPRRGTTEEGNTSMRTPFSFNPSFGEPEMHPKTDKFRRSKSRSRQSVSRTSSSLLPLETTPFGQQTFGKAVTVKCGTAEIPRLMSVFTKWEPCISCGLLTMAFPLGDKAQDVERRLNLVVQMKRDAETGDFARYLM